MTLYEIHIPGADDEPERVERVHGDNWLDALRRGLAAAGLEAPARNLGVEFGEDEKVAITDSANGRTYQVVPVRRRATAHARTSSQISEGPRPSELLSEKSLAEEAVEDALDDPFADDESVDAKSSGVRPMTLSRGQSPPRARRREPPPPPQFTGGLDTVDFEEAGVLESQEMARVLIPSRPPATPVPSHPLERELEALTRLGKDPSGACEFVLDTTLAHIPSDAGSILLIDARARCLYFAAVRGPASARLYHHRVPLEVGLAGACIRSRRSLNIDDPVNDARFARNIADTVGYVPRSILAAPIVHRRRAFGVLELLDRHDRRAYDDEDEALARRAARRLGRFFSELLPGR